MTASRFRLILLMAATFAGASAALVEPLHSVGEADMTLRSLGFSRVQGIYRNGVVYSARAVDAEGHSVRVSIDRRTGRLVGDSAIELSVPLTPPFPSAAAPGLPSQGLSSSSAGGSSYYIPPMAPRTHGIAGQPISPTCWNTPGAFGCR